MLTFAKFRLENLKVCYPQLSEYQCQCPQYCKAFDLDPLRQTKPKHIRVELCLNLAKVNMHRRLPYE